MELTLEEEVTNKIKLIDFAFSVNKGSPQIKSRRMRWAGHVARMGRRDVHTEI
jgi:hypothetical protein